MNSLLAGRIWALRQVEGLRGRHKLWSLPAVSNSCTEVLEPQQLTLLWTCTATRRQAEITILCSPEVASEGIEIGRYEKRAVEGATLMMLASVEVAGFAAACSAVSI